MEEGDEEYGPEKIQERINHYHTINVAALFFTFQCVLAAAICIGIEQWHFAGWVSLAAALALIVLLISEERELFFRNALQRLDQL